MIEFIITDAEEIEEKPYQIWIRGLIKLHGDYFKFDITATYFTEIETSLQIAGEQKDVLSYYLKNVIYKLLQTNYNLFEEQVFIAKSASTILNEDQIRKLWSSAIEALRRNNKMKRGNSNGSKCKDGLDEGRRSHIVSSNFFYREMEE